MKIWQDILLLTILCCFFYSPTAMAKLRICNDSSMTIGVALGYKKDQTWTSQGWWSLDPNECKTIIEEPLDNRFYYLYAENKNKTSQWNGPIPMCISDEKFIIENVDNCFVRGFQRAGFQEYDTQQQTSWTIRLNDIQNKETL
ncbi:DUF1036 domain-containing protein [Bartonella sp. DGB1]|uniref:DUF1036 domain-containing protein n=1 Tax=Bartonella sp. DGB1 TaxID=3239807 RepID=UPI0035240A94